MTTIHIQGMSCAHCVKAVEQALSKVAGVSRVESVDLETGVAHVAGDAAPEALTAAVEDEGYSASVARG